MEEILSTWLKASSDRNFLLLIAGRISGVHDEKETHRPNACQIDGSTVIIQFDESERLTISDAANIITLSSGELVVRDAGEVRFSWFAHRDSQIAPRLCEEVFKRTGRGVWFNRTGAPFDTSGFFMYTGDQFIVLRKV